MKATHLLAIALAAATAVVACGAEPTDSLGSEGSSGKRKPTSSSSSGGDDGTGAASSSSGSPSGSSSSSGGPVGEDGVPSGPIATNSTAGKEFFKANVFPILDSKCGSCHVAGPGTIWFNKDQEKAYFQLFQIGYVIDNSRIVQKPTHGGSTTNTLSGTEAATYSSWVSMELKDGGVKAPPAVLENLGNCFDKAKFDAMQLGQWRTTQRTNNNNTNNVTPWNENANNCTGCNQAACSTCHSADRATNFNNAVGNSIVEGTNQKDDVTFANTKLTTPAYITKYFGVSPDGKPIASNGISKKSLATQQDKAYSHPMFKLTTAQQTAVDAFVNDAIAKFTAGTCTAAPATGTPQQ